MSSTIPNCKALVDLLKFTEKNNLASEEMLIKGWAYADKLAHAHNKRTSDTSKRRLVSENILSELFEQSDKMPSPFTGKDALKIVQQMGLEWEDVSQQKITAALTMAVNDGRLTKTKQNGIVAYTIVNGGVGDNAQLD